MTDWLTWLLVGLLGAMGILVAILTVAVKVDFVEWCRYRDEKNEKERVINEQNECSHEFVRLQLMGGAYCWKCSKRVSQHWLNDQARQGPIKYIE